MGSGELILYIPPDYNRKKVIYINGGNVKVRDFDQKPYEAKPIEDDETRMMILYRLDEIAALIGKD